ncbi:hypothetical protein [Massilia sp. YIM B02443]|uniref:hypothetical protein n=1 Tax=Massilia sp. YIM B02443 TaxID=3050127 RepID=UPI0025B633C7|nr:hypothetical protein [Massilia sp. YIM B02443]MDN4038200.1 hypothetical protein [Massilia sp. YIM B02443]
MSFDIFLNVFERGEFSSMPLSVVETAFGSAIVRRADSDHGVVWRVDYPIVPDPALPDVVEMDGRTYPSVVFDGSDIYLHVLPGSGPAMTAGFMITRPAANEAFYKSLLDLLQSTHSVLFWPGDQALVVGQASTIEHLPEDMIGTLGKPFLATEPGQIPERIRAS